jgi:hypothetical protein
MKKLNTHLKANVTVLVSFMLILFAGSAYAQQSDSEELSLSIGAAAGVVPVLTFGNVEDSGAAIGVSGDLQYQNIVGQLDFVYILSESVGNDNFTSGMGFFGSLGYKIEASDKIHIPIMATGGASIIEYEAFGQYKDVSPQVGFTLAPYYMVNERTSVYSNIRYMKGFKGSEESDPIDLLGVTVGLRFTLL